MVELGTDITTWVTTLKGMMTNNCMVAVFLAVRDITSLCLSYAPA